MKQDDFDVLKWVTVHNSAKTLFSLEIHIDYSVDCKQKVVQAAIIIFLNYKIFSTIFEFC